MEWLSNAGQTERVTPMTGAHLMKFSKFIVTVLCSLLLSAGANAVQTIEAWNFYTSPPFLVDTATNAGLANDLVAYLNKALAGKYDIKLVLLPRVRLNKMIERGDKVFVIFMPSMLFGGVNGGSYLWTAPLCDDRQELVSRKLQPFEFDGPSSLYGVRFAAMLGHVFPVLAHDMDAGKIVADRNTIESSLISMLLAKHVDVITLPNSTLRYMWTKDPALQQQLWISTKNLGEFSRRLMFQRGMEKERNDFEQVVLAMNTDPAWIATLKKYGLTPSTVARAAHK
jgi:polar amino acid transport system substrate-binding protein